MAKLLISFLGASSYSYCNYYYEDQKIENVRFIQEAIAQIFCRQWKQDDRIIIFTTKEAYEKNWQDQEKRETKGLRKKLDNLNLNAQIINKPISNVTIQGTGETEIYERLNQLFDHIYQTIQNQDEIIFDITHAFRFQPMLGLVLLHYSKLLKNIKIDRILYGAFDVLGPASQINEIPVENRNVPILDLTQFATLLEWTNGADEFLNFGNAKKIKQLADQEIRPVLKNKQKRNVTAENINNLTKKLNEFADDIATCRGRTLVEAKTLKTIKSLLPQIEDNIIPQLSPIIKELDKKISEFEAEENVKNGFQAVRWCIDNNLIQQGITLLMETLITFIAKKFDLDYKEETSRNLVTDCFHIFNKGLPEERWKNETIKQKELADKILTSVFIKELSYDYITLNRYRNDINHGGYLNNAMKANKFEDKLNELYTRIYSKIFPDVD